MTLARDIMQKELVTVQADAPLLEAYRLFNREGISGAPVVADDEVVGVVSLRDLVRTVEDVHDRTQYELHFYDQPEAAEMRQPEWLPDVEEFEDRLARRVVADVMTSGVISVTPDASVKEMSGLLQEHRIHRLLVIDPEADGTSLVGLVSVFDLLPLLS